MAVSDRTIPGYEPHLRPERGGHGLEPGRYRVLLQLWRERRRFWAVAWKTALASAVVALLLPAHYESTERVVPGQTSSSGMMGVIGKLAGVGGSELGLDPASILGVKTPGALYVQILQSRTVQDRIIDRFNLRQRYWKLGRFKPEDYYTTRKKLASFTSIDEDKRSGAITVTITDYDPQTAARIASAYIEEMNRLAIELNTSDAHREKEFLESRLKQAKADLDAASTALSQYSSRNAIMDPQVQSKAMMESASRLQGELIGTQAELKGLEQIYSDDNSRIRTLRARQGELQSQLNKLVGSKGTAGTTANSGSDSDYPSLRSLPLLGSRYADLFREAKIQEVVYEFLTQQYESAKIQEAKELPTVRIMDQAIPPERKSAPKRSVIVLVSVMCALFLTACWIFAQNAWKEVPSDDPRRVIMAEINGGLKRMFRKSKN